MIYAVQFDRMNELIAFLTGNYRGGVACAPAAACKPASAKRAKVTA
jgi:hypothetical protein